VRKRRHQGTKRYDDFANDKERFIGSDESVCAAVCDILDDLGTAQAMHQRLRPLDPKNCVIVAALGRSAGWTRITSWRLTLTAWEIDLMDSLKPGMSCVHSTDYGGTNDRGGTDEHRAKRNGAVGCICDSMIRDCQKIML